MPDFSYAGYQNGEKQIDYSAKNLPIYNVIDFGAVANDNISDKSAIKAAIAAALNSNGGVIFFPTGRFIVQDATDDLTSYIINKSNIILKGTGSGSGGTELFMKYALLPGNPDQMWTGPPMFTFTAKGADARVGEVIKSAEVGEFTLELNHTAKLQEGDWVAIKMLNNSPDLIDAELSPNKVNTSWTYIVNEGVDVCMYYQVKRIKGNTITLHAPLAYKVDVKYTWTVNKFAHAEEVGIEDIAFVGNWKEKFKIRFVHNNITR